MSNYNLLEELVQLIQLETLLDSEEVKLLLKRTSDSNNKDYFDMSIEIDGQPVISKGMFSPSYLSEDIVKDELAAHMLKHLARLGVSTTIQTKQKQHINSLQVFNKLKDALTTAEWLIKSYLDIDEKAILDIKPITFQSDIQGVTLDVKVGDYILGGYQISKKNMTENEAKDAVALIALNHLARIGINYLFEQELQKNNRMTQEEIHLKIEEAIKHRKEIRERQKTL